MTRNRLLVYRFFELPHVYQVRIAKEFGIIDAGVGDATNFTAMFLNAKGLGLMAELWDRIEAAHDDGRYYPDNPFRE